MGVSDEKLLFERSEFMIFQTNGVFLRVEKFELGVLSTFSKVGVSTPMYTRVPRYQNKYIISLKNIKVRVIQEKKKYWEK
ncbi:hypothetical protein JCM16774_0052 [Pseudoleptotrichia goodfellowii]|uniref:Uncharacterized protein n=2 Tax=Pseudoleptotrichia goodfellowii TaxID=157692 RepID=A0A510J7I7_9FUSO|nr:hypothetical protein JCM16774_0052 [Pseudoleptotrichia goodfellowii]